MTTHESRSRSKPTLKSSSAANPPVAGANAEGSFFTKRNAAIITKRVFDVIVASSMLIVLSPVMLIIAILIRWKMGAPILYRQERIGQYERSFQILKFRTLINETERDGRLLSPEERLTKFGWFLRKHSLDELPQLWNVVRGDLSLVGPRPLLPEYLDHYSQRERLRHTVPAGITGFAQVTGRNSLNWDQKLELDAKYAETWSLRLDLYILGQTVRRVIHPQDVSKNAVGKLGERQKAPKESLETNHQEHSLRTSANGTSEND